MHFELRESCRWKSGDGETNVRNHVINITIKRLSLERRRFEGTVLIGFGHSSVENGKKFLLYAGILKKRRDVALANKISFSEENVTLFKSLLQSWNMFFSFSTRWAVEFWEQVICTFTKLFKKVHIKIPKLNCCN